MKRHIGALLAALACAGAYVVPAAARTAHTTATQICSKLSTSSVSSIVGYSVPAAVGSTLTAKANKADDYIAGTTLNCTFGTMKSMAELKKTVNIDTETVSKPLDAAEVKVLVDKTSSITGANLKVTPYPSLGSEAYLITFSIGEISAESMFTANGKNLYGASVYGKLATSKLASLVKLAEKL